MLASSRSKASPLGEAELSPAAGSAGRFRAHRQGSPWEPYAYLLPGLLIFGLFVALPLVGTIVLSSTQWDGYGTPTFIGLSNYVDAARDPLFRSAAWHNLMLIPYFALLPALLGLLPAVLVQQMKLRWASFFRVGLFLPYIMPGVLIGVVWRWLLNPVFGPVNAALKAIGLNPPTWLGDFRLALPTVGLIGAWAAYGFCYVVFLAGMQKIPRELYEAARLDGASGLDEFWTVTLPGLRREMAVVLSVNLINALRVFDVVAATTGGGPGRETNVVALHMIDSAFKINRVGYGTTLAVLLMLATLGLSLLVLRLVGGLDD
jgi:raffinose/stachyose/melibiose transport system permease protein